jgi:hypothetical protein
MAASLARFIEEVHSKRLHSALGLLGQLCVALLLVALCLGWVLAVSKRWGVKNVERPSFPTPISQRSNGKTTPGNRGASGDLIPLREPFPGFTRPGSSTAVKNPEFQANF